MPKGDPEDDDPIIRFQDIITYEHMVRLKELFANPDGSVRPLPLAEVCLHFTYVKRVYMLASLREPFAVSSTTYVGRTNHLYRSQTMNCAFSSCAST